MGLIAPYISRCTTGRSLAAMVGWLCVAVLASFGACLFNYRAAKRRHPRPTSTLGDIMELQVWLAESRSLPVTVVSCRHGGQRVALDLDGFRLDAWCYWPLQMRPVRLWSIHWIDKVGWGLDLQTNAGSARLYAWQLRCRRVVRLT